MKTRQMVIVALLSMAVFFAWFYASVTAHRRHPEWFQRQEQATQDAQTQPIAGATAPSETLPRVAIASSTQPSTQAKARGRVESSQIGYLGFNPDGKKSDLPMGVLLTPRGAALESVILNHFRMVVGQDQPYVFQQPYEIEKVPAALRNALATQSVIINGATIDLANVEWGIVSGPTTANSTRTSVTYAIEVPSGAGGTVVISKTYQVSPGNDPKKEPSLGYELSVRYAFTNESGQPVKVKVMFNGPHVPPAENTRNPPEVVAGYNDNPEVALEHVSGSSYKPDQEPTSLLNPKLDPKGFPLLWAGFVSAYFDAIARPELESGNPVADARVKALAEPSHAGDAFLALTFETTELTLAPGQTTPLSIQTYLGPRQRAILSSSYYEVLPRSYNKTLVLTGGPCGYCTFGWMIGALVWMLGFFHGIFHDWGLAIICLVVIVRVLLHPITKKSQVAMAGMSKMGPEIERLKKKYGDNKDELNKAMMVFYKEQGVTPILGCLPMLLQMPIWIALWSSLQSTFELRQASFLWGLTWIHDLSQPDRLIYFPNHAVDFFFIHIDAINILPILMAGVFYIQQKMTPKPVATTPEQEQQQKMMQWMSLLFPVMLYSGPAGLNLYILTSTFIGIIESKRIRDHIKEKEEAEKAGRIIVDAKPTRAAKRLAKGETIGTPEKKGCLISWLSSLQERAEQLRDQSDKRPRRG